MSDFYQILKREVSPQQPIADLVEPQKTSDKETLAVDKIDNNFIIKKNKKNGLKKTIPKLKKTVRQKNNKPLPTSTYATDGSFLSLEISNPIWLTMSETAKLGGIQKRTVKRAIRAGFVKYKIAEKRYLVDLRSALIYLFSKKKLWNKVREFGIGQYVEKWKK